MSLITKDLEKIDFIISLYESESNIFKRTIETIEDGIMKIIDPLADRFGLISNTSIKRIQHYSKISRVKDSTSLKEKLIRNNLINNFKDIIPDGFDNTNADLISKVKEEIHKIDDLLGIRILTDLYLDCEQMFELIKSHEFENGAKSNFIHIEKSEFIGQPVEMKNSSKIYKLKGIYDKKHPFELQIKSKILAAWDDMEHSIFYKNYVLTPVRDNTINSMIHVGKLLKELDVFLTSIRKANDNFKENAAVITFLSWLDANYSKPISDCLNNVNFRLGDLKQPLFLMFNYQGKPNIDISNELKYEHFAWESDDPKINYYISIRNNNYILKLSEAVILSWILKPTDIIDQMNLHKYIQSFLDSFVEALAKSIKEDGSEISIKILKSLIIDFFEINFKYSCNYQFLVDVDSFKKLINDSIYLIGLPDLGIESGEIKKLNKLLFIQEYQGLLKKATKNIFRSKEDDLQRLIINLKKEPEINSNNGLNKRIEKLNSFINK